MNYKRNWNKKFGKSEIYKKKKTVPAKRWK